MPPKPAPPKRPVGRPSAYSEAISDEICTRIVEGEGLRSICARKGMPNIATIIRWLADDRYADFRARYTRAREAQADALADEALHIADTTEEGMIETTKEWGVEVKRADMIDHRRLKVDTRKWYAAKLAPKKYSDKQQVEHSGGLQVAVIERVPEAKPGDWESGGS